jgi:NADH-quinone oxidoreductase subunit L
MQVAMGLLAIGAVGAGLVQIPRVDFVIDDFLRPSFAGSPAYASEAHTRTGLLIFGIVLGTVLGLIGIAIAYRIWVQRPGVAARLRTRLHPLYELLVNKWYFDELIDVAIIRPALLLGRLADSVLEKIFVGGLITGGSAGLVRASSAAVRRTQTGFLRYYAAVMVIGVFGVLTYFLVASS